MSQDVVVAQLNAALDGLEAWTRTRQVIDPKKAAQAKQNLRVVVQRAAELKAEYEACLARVRPTLERMTRLDQDALHTGRSPGVLGDVATEAQRFLRRLADAIAELDAVPSRADAWSEAKDHVDAKLSRRLAKVVEAHAAGVAQAEAWPGIAVESINQFMVIQRG
jgi:hypothetical protein